MATLTPLSNTEIASFCSQMAMVLHSGISAMEGIRKILILNITVVRILDKKFYATLKYYTSKIYKSSTIYMFFTYCSPRKTIYIAISLINRSND